MTTSARAAYPKFKALHPTTNLPLSGGLLYTYTRGTTTNKTTYSDIGKTTAHANPVVLDSAGEATIFLDGTYNWVLRDSAGVTIWTQDDINVQESQTALSGDTAFGLFTNGSFEDDTDGDGDPDGWTITRQGTVAIDNTDARHGAQCLKFTSTGSGGGYATTTNYMECSENNSYSIIFSVKSSVADIRNLVTVSWYDLDKVIIAGSPVTVWDDSTTNPTSWTEKRFSVAPPTGACFAKVIFYGCHSSDATSGNTKYDYIRMFDQRAMDAQLAGDLTVSGGDITLTLTDAAATLGPVLVLDRDSVTAASDADLIGAIQFKGRDDQATPGTDTYATMQAAIVDSGSGSEDGSLTIQTKVAGTLADRVVIAQGVQVGTPTGTDKGVGTLNLDNDLYKDGTNITTPAAVSAFVNGHVVYVHGTAGALATTFNVAANVIAAWESVGPTASGATNIWTALDSVPSTAKALLIKVFGEVSGTTTGQQYTAQIFARAGGDSSGASVDTAIFICLTGTVDAAGTFEGAANVVTQIIPISASRIFDLYAVYTGTGLTKATTIGVVGWIDSLI